MGEQDVESFGDLLRRLRVDARLTQEELAESSRLSPRSISDLERGVHRTARKDTADLLADALDLSGPARHAFLAAASGRGRGLNFAAAQDASIAADPGSRALVTPSPVRHNLPTSLTTFLGRDKDLTRLDSLLGRVRLVTLTGTGGVGKTRLAQEVGARAADRFPDGVWLVDVAAITDPGLVVIQIMEALGVRQSSDDPVLETLRFRLRFAELLLVLDNCEHLLDSCARLANELLSSSPGLRVLATSRELLGLPGEVSYQVLPLELPSVQADKKQAAEAPAVQLFLERGSAARGGKSDEVVPAAAAERICRKLDGLPLAIELAAARLGTLSAAEIEEHLTDVFRFLTLRRPAAHPRHQALQATMDWSYQLLSAEERRVFGELSVFAGTFGRDQAAAVCGADDGMAALELVDQLAIKSLLTADPAERGTRYRMLETVRQYAAERLAQRGGGESARQRHALAFLALAERENDLAILAEEHDNLRAALDWSLSEDSPAGPQLAVALGNFWLGRGLLQEGRNWLERVLAQATLDGKLRITLLRLLGTVLFETGDLRGASAVLSSGLEVAEAADASAEQARIRVQMTEIHKRHNLPGGHGAEALEECEAAIAVLNVADDAQGLAEAWLLVGKLHFDRNEWSAALAAIERAIAYGRQSGNHRAWIVASHYIGDIFMMGPIPAETAIERVEHLLQEVAGEPYAEEGILMVLATQYAYTGRIADARAAIARSQAINNSFAARLGLAFTSITAGQIEMLAGDLTEAERYYREGYKAFQVMGERAYLGLLAGLLAECLYAQGRLEESEKMAEEAKQAASGQNFVWLLWRISKAKVLARRGQFSAAGQLIAEAEKGVPSAPWVLQAMVLLAKAEVGRLAGNLDEVDSTLKAALQIYQDRHAFMLTEQVKALLANQGNQSGQAPG